MFRFLAAGLTALVELGLVNNPITRKQGYRLHLVTRLPRLCVADGQVGRVCSTYMYTHTYVYTYYVYIYV